jgi:hypothetical protein
VRAKSVLLKKLQQGNAVLKKAFGILAIVVIGMVGMTGQRYYTWVAQTDDPFDETGVEILRYMSCWFCGHQVLVLRTPS